MADVSWPNMSVDRYAALERATGVEVRKINGIWWQRVRPFFYRPLLPFKKYDLVTLSDRSCRLGVFQYAVNTGQVHNSYLNPIVFDDLQNYDVAKLQKNARNNLKKAFLNPITVRRIADERELSEKGHPVYVSFYERTKFNFDTSRRRKPGFALWAKTLLQFPEVVVLGAFLGHELLSFEITCRVDNAIIIKTIVNSDKALELRTPDLVLHCCRTSAIETPDICLIYHGMFSPNPGLNKYKIMRGARVLALPAHLTVHPALLSLIQRGAKGLYDHLHGQDNKALAC